MKPSGVEIFLREKSPTELLEMFMIARRLEDHGMVALIVKEYREASHRLSRRKEPSRNVQKGEAPE